MKDEFGIDEVAECKWAIKAVLIVVIVLVIAICLAIIEIITGVGA